jgi:hypothetical protein
LLFHLIDAFCQFQPIVVGDVLTCQLKDLFAARIRDFFEFGDRLDKLFNRNRRSLISDCGSRAFAASGDCAACRQNDYVWKLGVRCIRNNMMRVPRMSITECSVPIFPV